MQITGYLNFIEPGRKRGGIEALLRPVSKIKTKEITGVLEYLRCYPHQAHNLPRHLLASFRDLRNATAPGLTFYPYGHGQVPNYTWVHR